MNQESANLSSDFFVAGGTLRVGTPSYVKRLADDELFDRAFTGEFCYILTPRQMGKSSLMVRTAQRLQAEGVQTVIVDLTAIGTVEVEQWYLGIMTHLVKRLGLKINLVTWWNEHQSLGFVQRFMDFIREVVLSEIEDRVVIFIDEIDSTLKLDFRDDFFAAIRALYNARAADPEYNRISFVLLGVASPSDLIKNRTRTPFNIGVEIPLNRFSREDARSLEAGLDIAYPGQGAIILDYIFHWTAGHPYLTQKLCHELVEKHIVKCSQAQVDQLVQELFLSKEARRETNLQFVRDTLLSHPQKRQLLALYTRVHRGRKVIDDKQSVLQNQLKLSGLVIADDGRLRVHNELYRKAFSLAWVRTNTPVNWVPYVAVAATLIALTLAVIFGYNNIWLTSRATWAERCFYNPKQGESRLNCLAMFFRMKPILVQNNYPRQGRYLFFTALNSCEQAALFPSGVSTSCPTIVPDSISTQDLVDVVDGLHVTLADTDESGGTTVLLQAMLDALQQVEQTEDVIGLATELGPWVDARQAIQQSDYATAEEKYRQAIHSNPNNPATHFELAITLVRLSEIDAQNQIRYREESLALLDQVVALGKMLGHLDTETRTGEVEPTSTSTHISTHASSTWTTPDSSTRKVITPTDIGGTSEANTPVILFTPSPTIAPTENPTLPLLTSSGQGINPHFSSEYEIAQAVRRLIENNPELLSTLGGASPQTYPNLMAYIPTQQVASRPEPTVPSITATPSFTPIILITGTLPPDISISLANGCEGVYPAGTMQVFTVVPSLDGLVTLQLDGQTLPDFNQLPMLGNVQSSGQITIPRTLGSHTLIAVFDLGTQVVTRECTFTVTQALTTAPVQAPAAAQVIENNPPSITDISLVPLLPCENQQVRAIVQVNDDSGIDNVLFFSRPAGGDNFTQMPGTVVDDFTYEFEFNAPSDGGSSFYIEVRDIFGNFTSTQPQPNQAYSGFIETGIDNEPYCVAFLELPQVDLPGMDLLSTISAGSSYECLTLCASNLGCHSFTYAADNNTCWLKSGVPATTLNDVNTSGIKFIVPIPP